ncbi:acyltransferase family protein [Paenibacillus sp. NPDC056722]|uniref:acyltransferase family protein n=1 Tax=Paenibacillus sp. NPDC056722 TaxID=3345924 RepID=UPI00369C7E61
MENKRIEWIDISKGILIILVMLGHTQASPHLVGYIFSFHMPFFFFISGYLFNVEKYQSFTNVVVSKSKSILIPYIFFSVLSVIIYSVIFDYHFNNWYSLVSMFLESKRNEIFYNVPLWFFTTLFIIELLYFLIRKHINRKWIVLTILIALSGFEAIKYNTTGQPKLPWSFDLGVYYMVFFGIGNLIRNISINNKFIKKSLYGFCFIINILFLVSPETFNGVNNIVYSHGSFAYLWSLILGFAGIVTYIGLSKYVKSSKALSYLGKNTMIIFPLHFVLGYNLINVFVLVYKIPIVPSNITGFIFVGIELLILIPVVNIINSYFLNFVGKQVRGISRSD